MAKDEIKQEKKQDKKSSLKGVAYWLLVIGSAVFFVLYYKLGWITQAKAISRFFDASIRGVCTILIATAIGKVVVGIMKNVKTTDQRQTTILSLMVSMLKYVVIIVALVMVLSYYIEDTSSLFTGLGMLSMVIGLGCNKLIADVVAGIFIVLEGQYQVDDEVCINGTKGKIMTVGIRSTKLLDKLNNVKYINNSSISSVVNHSQTTSGAMIEIGIDYSESIDRVEAILNENLPKFKEDIPQIIAGPFYKGVVELADSAVILRIIAFATEEDKGKVKRKMLKKIKNLFDENHVEFPFPQMTISRRTDQPPEELMLLRGEQGAARPAGETSQINLKK